MSVTNDHMTDYPRPVDPMIAKMRKLREFTRGWVKREMDFKIGDRVALPAWNDDLHRGTVTAIAPHRFKVTWDRQRDERGRPLPRERRWYSVELIDHFTRG